MKLFISGILMTQIYLAELTVYDPDLPGTTTLRFTDYPVFNAPDAPGEYTGRIGGVTLFDVQLSPDPRQAGPQVASGGITLKNTDRSLDALLLRCGVAGHPFTLKLGDHADAYAEFTTILTGKMLAPKRTAGGYEIALRDAGLDLDERLGRTAFASGW